MGVIRRQGIKNTITTYLGILIGFVSLIVIQPHFLTKEELGLTRLLFSFSLLISLFVPMGVQNVTLRFFPFFKDKESGHHGFLGFILLVVVVGYLITSGGMLLLKDFIMNQYRRESPLFLEFFMYVFPLIFILSLVSILTMYCNVNYKTTIPSFLNDVVIRLATIGLVALYYLRTISFSNFINLFVAMYGLQLFALLGYIFWFEKPSLRIDWKYFTEKHIRNMMKYGTTLWLAALAAMGLKYFDTIMVGKFMPLAFVGIYTIAAFIPTVIEAPLNAFEKIASSRISFAWASNNKDEIYSIYHKSSIYMLLLGGWLFLMININTATLMSFLPAGYSDGRWVVMIISIGTLVNMATGLNGPILFNSDRYRYGAAFLFVLALLMLGSQMFLIPRFGLEGAAMGTAGSAILYQMLTTLAVWKFFHLQPFDRKNIRVALLIIVCFALNFVIPFVFNRYVDIMVRSIIITVLYASVIYFLKVGAEFHKYLPWHRTSVA